MVLLIVLILFFFPIDLLINYSYTDSYLYPLQAVGEDVIEGTFTIKFVGVTFVSKMHYVKGKDEIDGGPNELFDVTPRSGNGIKMKVFDPQIMMEDNGQTLSYSIKLIAENELCNT